MNTNTEPDFDRSCIIPIILGLIAGFGITIATGLVIPVLFNEPNVDDSKLGVFYFVEAMAAAIALGLSNEVWYDKYRRLSWAAIMFGLAVPAFMMYKQMATKNDMFMLILVCHVVLSSSIILLPKAYRGLFPAKV